MEGRSCLDSVSVTSYYDTMPTKVLWVGTLGILLLATQLGGVQHEDTEQEEGSGLQTTPGDHEDGAGGEHHHVALASWRWKNYGSMFLFTLMLILCVLVKIGFHYIPFLSKFLPESCFLILLGVTLAEIFYAGVKIDPCEHLFPRFTADLFFNVLLPPIILDSSFALYDRDFLSNFRSVVTFAVIGTIINIFATGFSLYGLASAGAFGEFIVKADTACHNKNIGTEVVHNLTATESLIFSSLISAVDPVAVLAIFEEIRVNTGLYFLVFGESLLNDGVTVVLYNTMIGLADIEFGAYEIILAVLSFFFVVFGGLLIGVVNGGMVSFITTKTQSSREIEPLLVFVFGYLAFTLAELVHWSGIISIIGFGLVVKRYAMTNMSQKSYTTVKYATKTLAVTSDCIIFFFLGIVVCSEAHHINWPFVLTTIALCTVYRFIVTFFLSWLTNRKRNTKICYKEQFIMAYGGLRGAVGFSLAVVLNKDKWYRELFVTTALAMVFFTVFIQGTTIKFLVKLMGISLRETEEGPKKLCPQIQETLIDNIMGGMETVIGRSGHFKMSQVFNYLDNHYFRRFLISSDKKETLERTFDKIILEEHYTSLYGPRLIVDNINTQTTTKKLKYTVSTLGREWNKGVANSSWNQYQRKGEDELTADQLLEERRKRARTMENRILSFQPTGQETNTEDSDVSMRTYPRQFGNRKSMIASMIISEYDKVSNDKKQRLSLSSNPASPTSLSSPPIRNWERLSRKVSQGNPTFTMIPEDDTDLEAGM